jgi:tetratricopeptide (TPR) repeat protein
LSSGLRAKGDLDESKQGRADQNGAEERSKPQPVTPENEARNLEQAADQLILARKLQDAIQVYGKAIAFWKSLDNSQISSATRDRQLAGIYWKIGVCLFFEQSWHFTDVPPRSLQDFASSKGFQDAVEALEKSEQLWQSILDRDPSDRTAQEGLAGTLEKLAPIYSNQLKGDRAIEAGQRCLALRQSLEAKTPGQPSQEDALARSYEILGRIEAANGSNVEAQGPRPSKLITKQWAI